MSDYPGAGGPVVPGPGDPHPDDLRAQLLQPDLAADEGSTATTVLPKHGTGRAAPRLGLPVLVAFAVAILGIGALIGGWQTWQNHSSAGGVDASARTPVDDGAVVVAPTKSATTSASPTPTATKASPSATKTATKSASPTAKPTTPTPTPSVSSTVAPLVTDRSVVLAILNATSRSGLARQVALQLRAQGWTVKAIGNWKRSTIRSTSIYTNGNLAAARTLQRDVAGTPSISGLLLGMRSGRMTLIIGSDYPG